MSRRSCQQDLNKSGITTKFGAKFEKEMASIFKVPKHKKFTYSPLYFNPEKEELDKRVRQSRSELSEQGSTSFVPNIKGKMKKNLISPHYGDAKAEKIRRLIILATIFLLIGVFYYLIKLYGLFFIHG